MICNIMQLVKNENIPQVAKKCDIKISIIRRYIYRRGTSTFILLHNVANTLGCDIEDLFTVYNDNDIRCNILKLAQDRNMPIKKVALNSNMSDVCIYKWNRQGTKSYINLYKIAKGLNCKIEDLFTLEPGEEWRENKKCLVQENGRNMKYGI